METLTCETLTSLSLIITGYKSDGRRALYVHCVDVKTIECFLPNYFVPYLLNKAGPSDPAEDTV